MCASKVEPEKKHDFSSVDISEQECFSHRLKAALRAAKYFADSPTQLAREFNVRSPGRPISSHAARKWLRGEAIPTQEKLRILARWLGVTTEWLRYDANEPKKDVNQTAKMSAASSNLQLIEDFHQLDDESREIAREVIRLLIRIDNGKK